MTPRPPALAPAQTRALAPVLAPVLAVARAGWLGASLLALGAALAAGAARGQEAEAPATAEAPAAEGATTVSHGYSYFGDLKYPADFPHLDYVNPEAPKGGEISLGSLGTFDSFNPYTIQGNATAYGTFGFEALMTSTADDPTALYCLICETLEYPESLDWVTFTLRPEAAFSDGSPLTARDVAFSNRIFAEQGLESFRMVTEGWIESVEVLDDRRVRFAFADAAPLRERIGFAGGLSILSEAEFERTGARLDESADAPFLSSGPYVLDGFDMGRRLVFARDADYWGADLPISRGRNNFDAIRVEYFADDTVSLEAFKAGEYTFRAESSSLLWATAYDFPAVQDGTVVREEPASGAIPTAQSWVFNLRREAFQDPRVREALALAFNFEWSNETLFYGYYARVGSYFQNTEMMAQGLPTPEEAALLQPLVDEGLLDPAILTAEAVVPAASAPGRTADRANLRRASALLDEAGWPTGEDGVRRDAAGEPLLLEFLEFRPTFERVLLPYIENLKALGVDARLSMVDSAQFTQRRDQSDFDIAALSPAFGFEPGAELEQWFGSASAAESNRNLMGLQDPAVDRLATVVAEAETREEMHVAARALDRVLRAERFQVWQWFKPTAWLAYFDVYDHPEALPPFATGELDFWWYDAARAEELRASGALR